MEDYSNYRYASTYQCNGNKMIPKSNWLLSTLFPRFCKATPMCKLLKRKKILYKQKHVLSLGNG
jgi:hypothetical protein